MTTYKIAVSSMALDGKIPAGDERWRDFNASFRNLDVLKSDIAGMINDGHAFTTWHRNQWRNAANYELGRNIPHIQDFYTLFQRHIPALLSCSNPLRTKTFRLPF